MRVLITGGAGYVGSKLVPALLEQGHDVVAYDTFWFGDHLPDTGSGRFQGNAPNGTSLVKVKADIRDTSKLAAAMSGIDAVIHLACISNDPSFELDEALSRTINLEAFGPLVQVCQIAGVRRFINCSTSSVYGISDAPDVREHHPLVPLTLYNTYKADCEEVLRRQYPSGGGDDFEWVTVRPSTICGYAPRQRLDLAVNILTSQAYHLGQITVLGGAQMRPNLHIDDMVDCYKMLLGAPSSKIRGRTFNVGAGNMSIADLAILVQGIVTHSRQQQVVIETRPITDTRSYQVNSDKIRLELGFSPARKVDDAVRDLCAAFDRGLVPGATERDEYYNVRQMRKVFPDLYRGAPPTEMDPARGVLSEIDLKHRGAGP